MRVCVCCFFLHVVPHGVSPSCSAVTDEAPADTGVEGRRDKDVMGVDADVKSQLLPVGRSI